MRTVYIAGPFRAKTIDGRYNYFEQHQNILRAEELAWKVWAAGAAAVCPHLNTIHFQGSLPDEVWLKGDIAIMDGCDVVLMTLDWKRSAGARAEHDHAIKNQQLVFYRLADLQQWLWHGQEQEDVA